jgi:hypothetical protein
MRSGMCLDWCVIDAIKITGPAAVAAVSLARRDACHVPRAVKASGSAGPFFAPCKALRRDDAENEQKKHANE